MSIAGKVKGLLASNGKDHLGLASALGISGQALSNKFYRDSFTTDDLIVVAQYTGSTLAFLSDDGSKTVIDSSDIKAKRINRTSKREPPRIKINLP